MLTETEARIYLSDQRGCTQSADYRSFHTFNFGSYRHESRQPFGALTVFNDDTLLPGKSHTLAVSAPTEVMLIPVIGGIELVDGLGESVFMGAGEVFHFTVLPDQEYHISNPFETEAVNYLLLGMNTDPVGSESSERFPLTTFDLQYRNQLVPVFYSLDRNSLGFIGKYEGRHEGGYTLRNAQKRAFVFVIEGAFEVQDRLLHPRDGLALWNLDAVEFEALSADAILLVLEV
ncbi:pirin family protein [Larkinella humicola]|uniref:Pirin n=1 Tax=Larkinella humicola TaxID=2607654 RepID=A0A5N1JMG4_9BACT|nr:pirin [Larkinella humicola]KAA9357331.1 pirin [Larkinella humicola]